MKTERAIGYLLYLSIAMATFTANAQESKEGSAEPQPAETNYPSGYFRIDTDIFSTQFWVGATYDLGSGMGLASDIYVVGAFAELDLGVSFAIGPVSLLPMAGIGFDFDGVEVEDDSTPDPDDVQTLEPQATYIIAPQLFSIVDTQWVYFESWIQTFFNHVFIDGGTDYLYTRNFILVKPLEFIAVGPQIELTYEFNNPSDEDEKLASLPIGGRVNVGYGESNTLGLFLGYDVQAEQLAGRFTFVRTW